MVVVVVVMVMVIVVQGHLWLGVEAQERVAVMQQQAVARQRAMKAVAVTQIGR